MRAADARRPPPPPPGRGRGRGAIVSSTTPRPCPPPNILSASGSEVSAVVDVVPVASVEQLGLAFGPVVHQWLPPRMLMLSDNESTMMRITAVDGACQLYGHPENARHEIRSMSEAYNAIYALEHPEDLKFEWRLGEACVAKAEFDPRRRWYRAKVVAISSCRKEVAVMYVDLGNIRIVKMKDIRIPRNFGNKVCMTNVNCVHERLIWSSIGFSPRWPSEWSWNPSSLQMGIETSPTGHLKQSRRR